MVMALSKKDAYGVMFKEYPDVVTAEQMSEMLGISNKTAYRLLKQDKIDHFMIGRTYKIPKIHIFSYLHVLNDG
jgi:excisionase family DNA binding protein